MSLSKNSKDLYLKYYTEFCIDHLRKTQADVCSYDKIEVFLSFYLPNEKNIILTKNKVKTVRKYLTKVFYLNVTISHKRNIFHVVHCLNDKQLKYKYYDAFGIPLQLRDIYEMREILEIVEYNKTRKLKNNCLVLFARPMNILQYHQVVEENLSDIIKFLPEYFLCCGIRYSFLTIAHIKQIIENISIAIGDYNFDPVSVLEFLLHYLSPDVVISNIGVFLDCNPSLININLNGYRGTLLLSDLIFKFKIPDLIKSEGNLRLHEIRKIRYLFKYSNVPTYYFNTKLDYYSDLIITHEH